MATDVQTREISDADWEVFAAQLDRQRQALKLLVNQQQPHDLAGIVTYMGNVATGTFTSVNDGGDEARAMEQLDKIDYSDLPSDEAEQIKQAGKDIADSLHQARKNVETKAADVSRQPDPDFDAWAKGMEQLRDQTKAKLVLKLDNAYAKLIETGKKHKKARPKLEKAGFGLGVLIALTTDLIVKAFTWIAENLSKIIEAIRTAAVWVWNQLRTGAEAVARFFGG